VLRLSHDRSLNKYASIDEEDDFQVNTSKKNANFCVEKWKRIIHTYKVTDERFTFIILIQNLCNKRVCPTKKEPQQQGMSYLEGEREGVREKERGGRAGQQACIFKVKLGLGEIVR
jgi:hypothetical protein